MDPIKDPAMAENLNRLGVRVVLKPFNLDDLLTAVAEMLAAQTLLDQALDGSDARKTSESASAED
jgi:hypothetical protein